jgi:hypothetical protein
VGNSSSGKSSSVKNDFQEFSDLHIDLSSSIPGGGAKEGSEVAKVDGLLLVPATGTCKGSEQVKEDSLLSVPAGGA